MASFYIDDIKKDVVGGSLQVIFRIHLRDVGGAEKEIKKRLVTGQQIYYGRLIELIRRLRERYPGIRKGKSDIELIKNLVQQIKRK